MKLAGLLLRIYTVSDELVKEARLNSRQVKKRSILKLISTQLILGNGGYVSMNMEGINIVDISDFGLSKEGFLQLTPGMALSWGS